MKRIIKLLLVFGLETIFISCNNETKNSNDEKQVVENEPQKEKTQEVTQEEKVSFDEEQILDLASLKDGEQYNDLTVSDYVYVQNDYFGFALKGEFTASGQLMIDEMWGELSFLFDEENNPHKNLILKNDDFTKQLISFCYFMNPDLILNELTDEQKSSLDSGASINVKIKVKDFSVGGKIDGYAESYIEFVEFVD